MFCHIKPTHNTFYRAFLVHSKVCPVNRQRYCVNVKLAASSVFVGVDGFVGVDVGIDGVCVLTSVYRSE
jgi:hypothetical protein